MLDAGRAHLLDAPHITLFPGLCLAVLVLGFNFSATGCAMRSIPARWSPRPVARSPRD